MAIGISTTYANSILTYLTGGGAPTAVAAFYVKLHTGDPGAAGANNAATEATRKQATMAAASGGSITTSADLVWTSVAATETVSHVSFWDAAAAGNFLGSDDLAAAQALTAGGSFTISAGSLTLTLTPDAA